MSAADWVHIEKIALLCAFWLALATEHFAGAVLLFGIWFLCALLESEAKKKDAAGTPPLTD